MKDSALMYNSKKVSVAINFLKFYIVYVHISPWADMLGVCHCWYATEQSVTE